MQQQILKLLLSTKVVLNCLFYFFLDSEQSPGVYLRDDHLFGNQPPHCELRVPTAEKAAHYLDAAIECRAPTKEDLRDSHLLFTLHVYQYSVAGKGGGKFTNYSHRWQSNTKKNVITKV